MSVGGLRGRWRRRRATAAAAPTGVRADPGHSVEGAPRPVPPPPAAVEGLRSPDVAARLARDGYVRLGPFLSSDEVAAARGVFDEAARRLGRPLGESWFPTILLPEDDVRALITDGLEAVIRPHLSELVDAARLELMRLDFSVKPASDASELGPHQDFSLVDERVATSLYLWIPLEDTDERNGTLHVVPGSHRFSNGIRSQHVPATFDEVLDLVREHAVRLDCRAGELIVMVSGVIHFSPANRSDNVRLAAHGILTPVDAPLVFYYADDRTPPDVVECYEFDIDGYVKHIHQGRPDGGEVPSELVTRPPGAMTRARFLDGLESTRDARATHPDQTGERV